MERLFDPAKSHFAAWVWLYNIDRYWIEPMSEIHPTRPEAVPLYYAALCGFSDLVEHLIAADSRDVNSRGGSHTTPLHAASVKGHLFVASLLLKNGADPNSRDDRGRTPLHRVSQGGQLVMLESSLEIARLLVNSGSNVNVTDDEGRLHYTQQHDPGIVILRNCYLDLAQVSKFGITINGHRCLRPVQMGSLTFHASL
jgi:ankyrin repeat protein